MADDTAKMGGLLQGLPQELKPPHLFQVDRASRYKFAASFFDTVFIFDIAKGATNTQQPIFKWLTAQDPKHLGHLQNIELHLGPQSIAFDASGGHELARSSISRVLREELDLKYSDEAAYRLVDGLTVTWEARTTGEILTIAYAP
ncbi:hypothetical protein CLAFUW4_12116 [Fulvia fulva]|uniref:Uncharacterized protein n=1 Tax=Passalora fulva TaxID=5499 RepID=A0A9Q8PEK1_PASFU|nr:uncharacterized protein CLAFUR5_11155 [Fulvia fulva]KAK4617722.1 hypothetical protein CLAFUR4_12121 [Fulvia fulva]KAK4618548.1 hypothetical protein CLAFUR0_12132 [Fulvia fulva]UJO21033.1 hypothetical protein CLAFUR5_11155 [Fulvia fulva]WPV18667.1 hypothetical protein CLAFUW4_12116 [Fulvia fulva]WPV33336.1 hypothetical protein CLAFUW7_12123 [Fulvia fulva]